MTPLQRFNAGSLNEIGSEELKEGERKGQPVKRPTRRKGKKRSTVDNSLRKAQSELKGLN